MFYDPDYDDAVVLDWRAYYEKFCAIHGDPLDHEGWLLFADGWRYSPTDYAGPEIPPPEDPAELLRLRIAYWETRRSLLMPYLERAQSHVDYLHDQRVSRSAPLPSDWLTDAVNALVRWQQDVTACEREIESLRSCRATFSHSTHN